MNDRGLIVLFSNFVPYSICVNFMTRSDARETFHVVCCWKGDYWACFQLALFCLGYQQSSQASKNSSRKSTKRLNNRRDRIDTTPCGISIETHNFFLWTGFGEKHLGLFVAKYLAFCTRHSFTSAYCHFWLSGSYVVSLCYKKGKGSITCASFL